MTATASNFRKAARPTALEVGAIPFNEAIDVVIGTAATLLVKPEGAQLLVMQCTAGSFSLKPGDYESAFPSAAGTTTTGGTAGTALWTLAAGAEIIRAAPDKITVKGAGASDRLQYFWV